MRRRRRLYSTLSKSDATALLSDFCLIVSSMLDIELRLFGVAYDKAQWFRSNPGMDGYDLYLQAFEHLVNRVALFLRRRHADAQPSKAVMIVDPHNSDFSAALKARLRQFQAAGTRWGALCNIVETVMFVGSHESPGVQVADLCTYANHRLITHDDAFLAQLLTRAFDREPATSTIDPGKLHGLRYYGPDGSVRGRIQAVWPTDT